MCEIFSKLTIKTQQGSTNCAHGDERARNVHAKKFLCAQNYVHVNQPKQL